MKFGRANLKLVAILLLSILTGVSVFSYTSGVEERVRKSYETKPVYIATRQIPAGTNVSSALNTGSIETREFPVVSAPSNALEFINQIDGNLVARYTIQPGQILLDDSFGTSGNQTGSLIIPDGMMAVTVQVQDSAKVANFVRPGSKIAIYATGQVKASEDTTTQVLLPEILVLAIGDQVLATDSSSGSANSSLITVSVSPAQAKKLIHASQNFTLYFGLLGSKVQPDLTSSISNSNIFQR
jgi:pilus assembly protein CpaB